MTDIGKVWLVGAGPGTPELLTVQGRELLEQATVVVYDDGQQALLEGCRGDVRLFIAEPQGLETLPLLLEYARQGHRVVRLFGNRGESYSEVSATIRSLTQAHIAFALVPGVVSLPTSASELLAVVTSTTTVPTSSSVAGGLVLRAYDSGVLSGKRLLLPRPIEQARVSAKTIRTHGAIPVVFPLLAIEDPEDLAAVDAAATKLSSYDWVLLTSANGTEKLISAVRRAGLDARAFAGVKIGVIGPKTAEPLQRFGLTADLVADEYVAEGLLLALTAQSTMKRVLLFRAAEAREVLPETLRARGVEVDVVAGYRTRQLGVEAAEPLRRQLREGRLDAVLVTSSSMGKSLVEALGDEAVALLARTTVASIGPVTTETLEGLGVKVSVVAKKYTMDGLLEALAVEWSRGATKESC